MEITNRSTDAAIARELGERIKQVRLNRGISQADLAARAGVSELTIRKLESGESGQTRVLLRVLRALELLHNVNVLLPAESASPIAQSDHAGRVRQRARRRKSGPVEWSWNEGE